MNGEDFDYSQFIPEPNEIDVDLSIVPSEFETRLYQFLASHFSSDFTSVSFNCDTLADQALSQATTFHSIPSVHPKYFSQTLSFLNSLFLSCPSISSFSLSNMAILSSDIRNLFSLIKSTKLAKIYFFRVPLGVSGVKAMTNILDPDQFDTITLTHCGISDDCSPFLVRFIKRRKTPFSSPRAFITIVDQAFSKQSAKFLSGAHHSLNVEEEEEEILEDKQSVQSQDTEPRVEEEDVAENDSDGDSDFGLSISESLSKVEEEEEVEEEEKRETKKCEEEEVAEEDQNEQSILLDNESLRRQIMMLRNLDGAIPVSDCFLVGPESFKWLDILNQS